MASELSCSLFAATILRASTCRAEPRRGSALRDLRSVAGPSSVPSYKSVCLPWCSCKYVLYAARMGAHEEIVSVSPLSGPEWRRVLRDFGGSALLILGIFYAVGSLVKLGQFDAAGLRGSDVLGLVPIQHFLLVGIARAIPIIPPLMLVFAVDILMSRFAGREFEHALAHSMSVRRAKGGNGIEYAIFIYIALLAVVLVSLSFTAPSIGALLGVGLISYFLVSRRNGRFPSASVAVGLALAVVAVIAVEEYTAPRPLARVVVVTQAAGSMGSEVIEGGLVAHADATWFVAMHGSELRAVSDDRALSVRVFPAESQPIIQAFRPIRRWLESCPGGHESVPCGRNY